MTSQGHWEIYWKRRGGGGSRKKYAGYICILLEWPSQSFEKGEARYWILPLKIEKKSPISLAYRINFNPYIQRHSLYL